MANYFDRKTLRLRGYDYSRKAKYFLTICTLKGVKAFSNPCCAEACLTAIKSLSASKGMRLIAYCLMPDHVHLLVENIDGMQVPTFVNMCKGSVTKELRLQCEYHRPLWQRSFYDHIVRNEESVDDIVQYILQNPVRAGLVDSWHVYPYSDDILGFKENSRRHMDMMNNRNTV